MPPAKNIPQLSKKAYNFLSLAVAFLSVQAVLLGKQTA